jgi:tetratricopeptide (TPR) repeat protein
MATIEWFRRTTWNDADREEFSARLKRSRGAFKKAQYLRIQASHLAEAGHHAGALELLDRLFAEFPERTELAQAHAQKASSLASLGQIEAALQEYRAALQTERDFPHSRTNAWLDFAALVVDQQLVASYEEASQVLREFGRDDGLTFPVIEYRCAAMQALLADARGESARARDLATLALAHAAEARSGLAYHPNVGLVGAGHRKKFETRLRKLARG